MMAMNEARYGFADGGATHDHGGVIYLFISSVSRRDAQNSIAVGLKEWPERREMAYP